MDPAYRVAESAGLRAVERHGVVLIGIADAPAFAEACGGLGYAILGIDGFTLHDDGALQPIGDAILDSSDCLSPDWAATVRRATGAAAAFLRTIGELPVTHVEFVLAERPHMPG